MTKVEDILLVERTVVMKTKLSSITLHGSRDISIFKFLEWGYESVTASETPSDSLLSLSVPVSRPVLTLRASGAQAVVGDVMELHCESRRGSPPILYRFYHEDVSLGSSSVPSGRAFFNLSLTAEHSGNYSCEADNGLGVQLSDRVTLSVTGE